MVDSWGKKLTTSTSPRNIVNLIRRKTYHHLTFYDIWFCFCQNIIFRQYNHVLWNVFRVLSGTRRLSVKRYYLLYECRLWYFIRKERITKNKISAICCARNVGKELITFLPCEIFAEKQTRRFMTRFVIFVLRLPRYSGVVGTPELSGEGEGTVKNRINTFILEMKQFFLFWNDIFNQYSYHVFHNILFF